jgi:membrane protease YdiL (CAAX protease family)
MQIKEFLDFIKKPGYREDGDNSFNDRLRIVSSLLMLALAISLALAFIIGILGELGPWNIEDHAFDALFEKYAATWILFLGCIVAPVMEELIFRGPMWFFRDSRYFPAIFYGLTLAFALIHLSNFPNVAEIWPIAPVLISPQLSIGLFLGFIRVRFGLLWSMAFHAAYNFIFLAPVLLLNELGIPFS